MNDVPLRVVGVLSAKWTNIIGIDQDDILLAPWTTIKYRVSGGSAPSAAHSSAEGSPLAEQLDLLARLEDLLYHRVRGVAGEQAPHPVGLVGALEDVLHPRRQLLH